MFNERLSRVSTVMLMKTILVTGSEGFLGRNLCVALSRCEGIEILRFDVQNTPAELEQQVARADFIFHLAGVNRPKDEKEFAEGNTDLTRLLCDFAEKHNCRAPILLSSSTQAASDNAYGKSKRAAEDALIDYSKRTGIPVFVYRFPNLFGKWSRPNYNSVVSTFCYNVTHDLPIQVNDPSHTVTFAYVDDVVDACVAQALGAGRGELGARTQSPEPSPQPPAPSPQPPVPSSQNPAARTQPPVPSPQFFYEVSETYSVSLGRLAELVKAFRAVRDGGPMPDLSDPFTKKLYATFLSYYETDAFAYSPKMNTDNRGWLFELIKSEQFGQIFVSQTHPGITRGNHGHNTKVEKFCVIQGRGVIRFRQVVTNEICEYKVSGETIQIVDIPPGYTHSIENTGDTEMITLFWANEIFNPEKPDTYFEPVLTGQ
jgi:UDP-2-acetamido-2,6-beta-L-arabino-hexul-4-ose reductase